MPCKATAAKMFDQPEPYITMRIKLLLEQNYAPEIVGNELLLSSGMAEVSVGEQLGIYNFKLRSKAVWQKSVQTRCYLNSNNIRCLSKRERA